FQRTTDPDAKPLPVTMSVSAGLPATAVVGARLVITGTGEGCSGRSMPVLSNVAVTAALAFIVQEHVPVPLQAPLQPMNVEPDAAVAVSVIDVPMGTAALQVAPQEIPAGSSTRRARRWGRPRRRRSARGSWCRRWQRSSRYRRRSRPSSDGTGRRH